MTSDVDIHAGSTVPRSFFARPSEEVAPELLGKLVVRDSDDGRCVLRVTEVEALSQQGTPLPEGQLEAHTHDEPGHVHGPDCDQAVSVGGVELAASPDHDRHTA